MSQTFGATPDEREALLAAARKIAPQIREAVDEIEAARQLPTHVVQLLKDAGAFALLQPRWLGGHDADPVTQILFIEEIAKADASAAWCVMIGCDGGLLTRELDPDLARARCMSMSTPRPAARHSRPEQPSALTADTWRQVAGPTSVASPMPTGCSSVAR